MHLKTIGVLGGLGPETTAHFYLAVVSLCKQKGISDRPPLLIWNIPLPYAVEKEFITTGKGIELYLPFLIEGAKKLEHAGADFVVIPCNSVHILIDEIRKSVQIPVLSILEETADFLSKKKVNNAGILATTATVQNHLYDSALEAISIKSINPDTDSQQKLSNLIQKLVQDDRNTIDQNVLPMLIDDFKRHKVDAILLACTDLQLLVQNHPDIPIYDTMQILVEATVRDLV